MVAIWKRRCASFTASSPRAPKWRKLTNAPLKAVWAYGETTEVLGISYRVEAAQLPPGKYRNIWATRHWLGADGSFAAERQEDGVRIGTRSRLPAIFCTSMQVQKFLAFARSSRRRDCRDLLGTVGASYGGAMGVTTSSGPGNRTESRSDGPGRDAGTAAADQRRTARWSKPRAADQDRAS